MNEEQCHSNFTTYFTVFKTNCVSLSTYFECYSFCELIYHLKLFKLTRRVKSIANREASEQKREILYSISNTYEMYTFDFLR